MLRELGKNLVARRRAGRRRRMAGEMGKPVTQGLAEVDKCALLAIMLSSPADTDT
ncbi:MAG: hypothetical protein U5L72_19005 [Bacteroidales bacterium]|nr:hypothetical protein [Bacteroidales bacterium]